MNKKIVTLFALLITITLLTACSSNNENFETESSVRELEKTYIHSSYEIELLDLVNGYRVSKGLIPLEIIQHISYKGSQHNDYMIVTNSVNHDGFDERKMNLQQVLGAYRVGENVAYGFASAQATMNAWINSEAHRNNLMGDYTHFGISIKEDANGKKYYTNMYIKK
ncbi:MAG: CAP domain-containing protein [Flavobacterium sp.]|nr:CAP domain-containing protein [Flavobacterium sp.]